MVLPSRSDKREGMACNGSCGLPAKAAVTLRRELLRKNGWAKTIHDVDFNSDRLGSCLEKSYV